MGTNVSKVASGRKGEKLARGCADLAVEGAGVGNVFLG